jgi:hypothetical protein
MRHRTTILVLAWVFGVAVGSGLIAMLFSMLWRTFQVSAFRSAAYWFARLSGWVFVTLGLWVIYEGLDGAPRYHIVEGLVFVVTLIFVSVSVLFFIRRVLANLTVSEVAGVWDAVRQGFNSLPEVLMFGVGLAALISAAAVILGGGNAVREALWPGWSLEALLFILASLAVLVGQLLGFRRRAIHCTRILCCLQAEGRPMTRGEIQEKCHLGFEPCQIALAALQRKGKIVSDKGIIRVAHIHLGTDH